MRSIIVFAVLALAAAVYVPRFVTQTNNAAPAPVMMASRTAPPAEPAPSNSRAVTVPRNGNGHFQVEGRINGRRLDFMVDTGASVIALTSSDAAMLGIHPAQRDFRVTVKTANGTVMAAPAELDRVEISDLTVRKVAALVLPDGALSENLLGLSFLSRLRSFTYSNGRLVLEQ
jgi:aspartyl protease family protein